MGKDIYLVIGGSGFLGRHIVDQLRARGDNVSVFDIVQRYHDVPFYAGDITSVESLSGALKQSGTTCIIHTASPPAGLTDASIYYKVNVDGTQAVVDAAIACGVKKLVFTSSAGVVFNGGDIIDVDERLPYPSVPMDAYNDSKAKAESVVTESNGKGGLLTVALRPAGIFGPGDRQVMAGLWEVYEGHKTHFQIGDNNNLFDYTYVGNVAKAHLLAADKLEIPAPAPTLSALGKQPVSLDEVPDLNEAEHDIVNGPLPPITATLGHHQVPTSFSRPLGPYVSRPENADELEANWKSGVTEDAGRPVIRTRFDPMSATSIKRAKIANPDSHPLQVAGQVFFITNGEPVPFWDFHRGVYIRLDKKLPGYRKPRGIFRLPRPVGFAAAQGSEWFAAITGKTPTFTKFRVTFATATRWHNIEKARRVLGYEPDVGLEEGIDKMVEWWFQEYQAGNHKQKH